MKHLAALLIVFPLMLTLPATAQRVLLLEKANASNAKRITVGEELKFRMLGDDFWQQGVIREMRPDLNALVINDRYVPLEDIETLHLGSTFAAAAGIALMTFSVSWTGIGLVGYNTDKDPTTNFTRSDVTIAVTSAATGFLLWKLFGQKKVRLGKKHRLRMIDTTFG